MSVLRYDLVNAVMSKTLQTMIVDINIHDNVDKQYEFMKQMILYDKSLAKDEQSEAIKRLTRNYDRSKILFNSGKKRICENCLLECFATSYCELCIRSYLKAKFSNWTSGNNDIDDLIQKCQIETFFPFSVAEWIPYNNLQNIKFLTKGGFSEIYIADWIGGNYIKWNSKKQRLIKSGTFSVILKRLENVKNANRSWLDEAKSHLCISNRWNCIIRCFGLTQNPSNKDYMLVMYKCDIDLRNYFKKNHNLTWKKRINIAYDIIMAITFIHDEKAVHRDLHSGNVLYVQQFDSWYISDLGFCGPADRPLGSIYGNLPYIAPEVISGKGYTFASDIYSIGMLMWEISSGYPPFADFNDPYLAMNITQGIRPKIVPGTPLIYKKLMQQCWDANPKKRPDIVTLWGKINKLNVFYKNKDKNKGKQTNSIINSPNNSIINSQLNTNTSTISISSFIERFSKIHFFKISSEPRNATEEELEDYYSKQYEFTLKIASENQTEQNNCTMIVDDEIDNNDHNEKNASKRIYSNSSYDEDLDDKSKKIKLENQ